MEDQIKNTSNSNNTGWISCFDRMPELNPNGVSKPVIVYSLSKGVKYGCFDDPIWREVTIEGHRDKTIENVVFLCEIPELPKYKIK